MRKDAGVLGAARQEKIFTLTRFVPSLWQGCGGTANNSYPVTVSVFSIGNYKGAPSSS
jgi:hypothetical protein